MRSIIATRREGETQSGKVIVYVERNIVLKHIATRQYASGFVQSEYEVDA